MATAPIPDAITHEQLVALPIARYEGEVSLVATPAELDRAREELRAEQIVGFDTETRPAFRKGESHLPSLMQVATSSRVYLFQLARVDCSAVAAALLGSPAIIKTGIGLDHDLAQLKRRLPFDATALVDLGEIAKRHGLRQSGLRNLAGLFLGFRIPKGAQTSNWAAPRLSEQQISYAATDAWACRQIYLRFQELGMLTAP